MERERGVIEMEYFLFFKRGDLRTEPKLIAGEHSISAIFFSTELNYAMLRVSNNPTVSSQFGCKVYFCHFPKFLG